MAIDAGLRRGIMSTLALAPNLQGPWLSGHYFELFFSRIHKLRFQK